MLVETGGAARGIPFLASFKSLDARAMTGPIYCGGTSRPPMSALGFPRLRPRFTRYGMMQAGQQRVILRWAGALVVALLAAACASEPDRPSGAAASLAGDAATQGLDDLTLVDCMLPSQIRQLGTRMTYLAPRKRVKTTKSDCGIRGGEFVLFDRSDYRTALRTLLPQAEAGDAVAQTYVGEIYEKGLGLAHPDYGAAATWYRRAAANGYGPAQTSLGSLYERGLGVPLDRVAALDWYRRAVGLSDDGLVFESELKRAQAEFDREIDLRNRIAASLRAQLLESRSSTASPAPLGGTPTNEELERVAESLGRDTASERERVERELHALEELKKVEGEGDGDGPAPPGGKKAAQIGKLELSLRRQSEALADNEQRLSMLQ